ncbi:MAG: transglutaminase-like domain-containing protein [Armatimonadota bacterium]
MRHLLGFDMPRWNPVEHIKEEGSGTWFVACIYTWVTMIAALLSVSAFMANPLYVGIIGVLIVAAFPVAYYLHYTRISRLTVNWTVFIAAVVLGVVQFTPAVRAYLFEQPDSVFTALRSMVAVFLWITAFRAFSLRSITELVQTILPTTSIVLLSLVAHPHWSALAALGLLILGALGLLSIENSLQTDSRLSKVSGMEFSETTTSSAKAYSWPTIYVLAIAVAIAIGFWTARVELSSRVTNRVQLYLARRLAMHLIRGEIDHAPGASIWLPRTYPPTGRAIVMEVKCERPTNWRTGVYHGYTGQAWTMQLALNRAPATGANEWKIPEQTAGLSNEAVLVEQEITPYVPFGAAIPCAYRPVRIRADVPSVTYGWDGVIAPVSQRLPKKPFYVLSKVPPTLPETSGVENPPTREDIQRDLELPEDYSPRVRALAENITSDATTEFESVRAIETYLMNNYTYDLHPSRTWPDDFVEAFLFKTQSGYCYHFASAMVVMCRTLDIPARMAVGFMRGETSTDDDDLYIVRSEDAHAWPEVYLQGMGWMVFEPTPGAREEAEERTFGDVWRDAGASLKDRAIFLTGRLVAYWQVGLVVVVFIVLAAFSTRYYLVWVSHHPPRYAGKTETAQWAYRQMRHLLDNQGAKDLPHLSAYEFLETIPPDLTASMNVACQIVEDYLVVRFRPSEPDDEIVDRLVRHVSTLQSTIKEELRARAESA